MNADDKFCMVINTDYGEVGFVWSEQKKRILVKQILLPRDGVEMYDLIAQAWPDYKSVQGKTIPDIVYKIEAFLKGERISFKLEDLGHIGMARSFKRDILTQTLNILPGMVETYGGLASKAGYAGAARAVGTVMANNKFPLVIPCHRVIRSNGHIGLFGGGQDMKRRLLVMEGVTFDKAGRVASRYFYC
ncbi:MAG: MGMT family protein [Syntrophaceae bacterium]|nr:MGMT family protein [Syntrophaceae bacterium]